MTYVQVLMRPKDDASPEYPIVDGYMQEEHAKSCFYDWSEVILDLYDSGRERLAKRIVDLLCRKL